MLIERVIIFMNFRIKGKGTQALGFRHQNLNCLGHPPGYTGGRALEMLT